MSRFLFSTQNSDGTTALYSTDGTASGTLDLGMSRFGFSLAASYPAFSAFDGKLVFLGTDVSGASNATGVYSTDGTAAGTSPALITGKGGTAVPDGLWVLNSVLLTSGTPGSGAQGLWASADGASFTQIETGISTSDLVISGGVGIFAATDGAGQNAGLWRTDGTTAGAYAITPSASTLDPQGFVAFGSGKTLFANQASDGTVSLWITDGTASGTHAIVNAGLGRDIGTSFTGAAARGRAIFTADDAAGNISVWSTDGTASGTIELRVNGPDNVATRTPYGFIAWNGKVLFSSGYGLVVSDGTKAGTVELTGDAPISYTTLGAQLFFIGFDTDSPADPDGLSPTALYVSDGTAAGTHVLRVPGLGSLGQSQSLTVAGGKLVFSAFDASGKEALFTTDGTVAGTHELALPSGIVLDPSNPPQIASLPDPSGTVTLGGGDQVYAAASGVTVQAGSGHDTVTAASGNVTVLGGSGSLTFLGGAAPSSVSGGAGSATILGGAGGGNFTGGAAGHNILVSQGLAAGGNTTLTGAASGDQLFGSAHGNDVINAGDGRETIVGGGGHDTITGGSNAGSVIFTASGADLVQGGAAGRDTIVGGSGNLVVNAHHGDAIFGGSGSLSVDGSEAGAADSVIGGAGNLTVNGAGGNLLVVGGTGASSIATGNGADLVFTGGGKMDLTTGTGASQIVLEFGDATVNQGSGATVYDAVKGLQDGGIATISGFRPGTDAIDLFGYRQSNVSVTSSGGQTTISFADGKQIHLLGVADLGNSLVIS